MGRGKTLLITAVVLATVSIADAELILTIDGLDTTKTPEIRGKDNLVITIAGQSDIEAQNISVTCDTGKLEPLKEPNKYLFTFTAESDVSTISLNVYNEIVYQLVLFYIPETNTIIVFCIDKESLSSLQMSSESQLQAQSEQQIPEPETYSFATFSIGDCNEILDPNWYPNLNNDSFVNFKDFAILAANWLLSGAELDGDINGSGAVDNNDLAIFTYYWLANACGPSPEEVFESFKSALAAGDANEALTHVAEISREKYAEIFQIIEPNLPDYAAGMGELTFDRQRNGEVIYEMRHQDGADTLSFPVFFIREGDGNWRLFNF